MRAAFDRVLAQVQEVSQLLLKVQGDALAVLNEAAAANAQALGGAAPNFAEMQKTVIEAMQNASRQVTAAIDEMRQRMTELQEETRQAMGTAPGSVADQSVAGEEDPLAGVEQGRAGNFGAAAKRLRSLQVKSSPAGCSRSLLWVTPVSRGGARGIPCRS